MVSAVQNSSNSSATNSATSNNQIDPQQFLKIMIKELQQQDPSQPMSSKDLVSQMAQIRDIQSSMDLSSTLKDLALGQRLSSAGTLLGKEVTGKNSKGDDVSGIVTSVKREGDKVYLELDSGNQLSVDNVLTVNNPTAQNTTNTTNTNTNTNTAKTA